MAIDDELFRVHAPVLTAPARRPLAVRCELPCPCSWLLRRVAQASAESRNRSARTASLKHERRLAAVLSFSGRSE